MGHSMHNEPTFAITNLHGYAYDLRQTAADTLCPDNTSNIDEYINLNEMINLVKEKCLGFDDQDRPIINETVNEEIFEETSVWITNIGLSKLAGQDLIECAWDNKLNEMIFWKKT